MDMCEWVWVWVYIVIAEATRLIVAIYLLVRKENQSIQKIPITITAIDKRRRPPKIRVNTGR